MRTIIDTTIGEMIPDVEGLIGFQRREMCDLTVPWPRYAGDFRFVMTELEPSVRTIRFKWHEDKKRYKDVQWNLPYLQFLFCQTQFKLGSKWPRSALGVAASEKPFEMGNSLQYGPFPNVYDSGFVCQGTAPNIEEAIAIFFGSRFDNPFDWGIGYLFNDNFLGVGTHDVEAYIDGIAECYPQKFKWDAGYPWILGGPNPYCRVARFGWLDQKFVTLLPFIHHTIVGEWPYE
jgi:hypothetical protein